MSVRVTATEVKEILDTTLTDAIVDVFIVVGSQLTDRVTLNDTGSLMNAAELKELERWLSAHFAAIKDVRSASEKAGSVSQKFQYKVDLNLNQTQYGTTALILDVTGYLAKLNADAKSGDKVSASMFVGGTSEDDYPTDEAPDA